MSDFNIQQLSLAKSADSDDQTDQGTVKTATSASSPAHRLLRNSDFESGAHQIRPRRHGDGYGFEVGWANWFQSGKKALNNWVTAAQDTAAQENPSSTTPAPATSSLPVAPKSLWGTKIADVHGVDVRRNHPTSAALLRQEIPGIDAPGDPLFTSLRGEYGLMYQCVELVNRYYATRLGHQNMAVTGNANAYLGTGDRGLDTYKNPSTVKPQEGDLMVNTDLGKVGHVGIVKSVGAQSMEVAQQNTSNPVATASLSQNGNAWTIGGGWDGFRRKPGTAPVSVSAATQSAQSVGSASSPFTSLLNWVPGDFVQRVKDAGPKLYETTVGVLKKGDRGPKVEALQHQLVAAKYMTAEEMATGPGIFGDKTLRALKAYQTASGLPVTGTLDPGTFFSLVGNQLGRIKDAAQKQNGSTTGAQSADYATDLMGDPLMHTAGSYTAADTAFTGLPVQDRVKHSAQNQTGGFNVRGKSTGQTWEVVRAKKGPYIRRKSQKAKDAKAVGPNAANNPAGSSKKTNLEATGTLFEGYESGSLAGKSGNLGPTIAGQPVTYDVNAGGYEYGGGGALHLDDGVELELGGVIGASLVDGKLQYKYPTIPITLWGEKILLDIACRVSAEVAIRANGKLAVDAAQSTKGVVVGAGLSGEAFAGARAGFILTAAAGWQSPDGIKDIVGGYVGAEAWAGAAASAGLVARLMPSVKFEGYLGAAVGVGAKLQAGVEAHLGNAAKLGYLLASHGLKEAWRGLENCGQVVAEWLESGAGALYQFGDQVVDSVGNFILGNREAIATVNSGSYQYLGLSHRAKLINQMLDGTCGNDEEQAILVVLRDAKRQGQLYSLITFIPGGIDALNSNFHFAEQDELDKLLKG